MEKKRCFIENDTEIDDFDIEVFEELTGLEFEKAFIHVITSAFQRPKEVFEAIVSCEEIWISTAFIGESLDLLKNMADAAIGHNIRDKVIVNLRPSDRIHRFLPKEYHEKLTGQNIKFIFKEDYI